jgi:hypothetical protein
VKGRPVASADSESPVPADEKVAADMRRYAEIFVMGVAAAGEVLGWDAGAARQLDKWCEIFLASSPDEDGIRRMVLVMGAYLGELIVRNGHGRWTYDPRARAPGVDTPARQRCFPHNKVTKRLTVGAEHSLWVFYDVAVTGRIPAGVRITPRNPPGPADADTG